MNPILVCEKLSKMYRKNGLLALDQLDLSIPAGCIVGLLGPNGCGKTTLIKLACGLLTPTSGSVRINGMLPGVETKSKVSYLPEQDYCSSHMRVNDLLAYFLDFYQDFDKSKAIEMLQRLHINPERRIQTLSKGTREKVQLVLVMSRAADLYLLDEPIGGVDPASRDYVLDTIISNYRENATVVISTHLIADIEKVLDKVVFINRGMLELASSVDEIRESRGKSVDALFREVYKC